MHQGRNIPEFRFFLPIMRKKLQNTKKIGERMEFQVFQDLVLFFKGNNLNFSVYDFIEQFFPLILFT